jgi:hypothetical protein
VPGLILAAVSPDNTPHGYNWTFAFPMLLFIVIALILYALFSRPHRRVPARPIQVTSTGRRAPDAQSARAAAVAGGLSTAPGGGAIASAAEPEGVQAVASEPAKEPGGATLSGSVDPEDTAGTQSTTDEPDDSMHDSSTHDSSTEDGE